MSEANIEYSSRAVEQLEKLETDISNRIVSKLDDVAWNPEHYLKGRKMVNSSHYSLVVGDYRVIIDWKRNEVPEVLFVRRVGHRKNISD